MYSFYILNNRKNISSEITQKLEETIQKDVTVDETLSWKVLSKENLKVNQFRPEGGISHISYSFNYPDTWMDPQSLNYKMKTKYDRDVVLQSVDINDDKNYCFIVQSDYLNPRKVDAISWWGVEGEEFRGFQVEAAKNILISNRPAVKYVSKYSLAENIVNTAIYTTADSVNSSSIVEFIFMCVNKRNIEQEKVFDKMMSTLKIELKNNLDSKN